MLWPFLTWNFPPPLLCQVNSSWCFQTQPKILLLLKATSERLGTQKVWGARAGRQEECPAWSHNEAPQSCFVRVFPGSGDTLSSPSKLLLRMSGVSRQKREQSLMGHLCFFWLVTSGSEGLCRPSHTLTLDAESTQWSSVPSAHAAQEVLWQPSWWMLRDAHHLPRQCSCHGQTAVIIRLLWCWTGASLHVGPLLPSRLQTLYALK